MWPMTVVLHAADDRTVPVSSAREFVCALQHALGEEGLETAPTEKPRREPMARREPTARPTEEESKLVRYVELDGGHGEIMVSLMSRSELHELPELARLFVREVTQPRQR